MIRQLCLFLVLSSMIINGMEIVLSNNDLLSHITHELCAINRWNLKNLHPDIVHCICQRDISIDDNL